MLVKYFWVQYFLSWNNQCWLVSELGNATTNRIGSIDRLRYLNQQFVRSVRGAWRVVENGTPLLLVVHEQPVSNVVAVATT